MTWGDIRNYQQRFFRGLSQSELFYDVSKIQKFHKIFVSEIVRQHEERQHEESSEIVGQCEERQHDESSEI